MDIKVIALPTPAAFEQLRKEKGLTQDGLAEVLGQSRSTIFKWEAGSNFPNPATLYRLSELYGVIWQIDSENIPPAIQKLLSVTSSADS